MKNARPSRPRRLAKRGLFVLFVITTIAAIWAWPRAGRYLVVDMPLEPADAIVVLAGPRAAARWLEAVDLHKEKVAPSILLSAGRIVPAEEAVRARGITFPREVDLVRAAMLQMGVPAHAIETFPGTVDNTAAEATIAREFATARRWRRVIVVTSKYHTRRTLYAFERAFRGTGITIRTRGTRFDTSHPDEWWKHRADIRFVLSEYGKLLAYRLGLEDED